MEDCFDYVIAVFGRQDTLKHMSDLELFEGCCCVLAIILVSDPYKYSGQRSTKSKLSLHRLLSRKTDPLLSRAATAAEGEAVSCQRE